jgi:predicted nuclease of restriction endonuclease-like (RecB) superfamily
MIKSVSAYRHWLKQLKDRIRSSQIKAAIKVNTELLNLYWELGKEILDKEKKAEWGIKLISRLSEDLLEEFPDIKGFSRSNLYYVRQWVQFYYESSIVQQAVGQLKIHSKKRQKRDSGIPLILATIPWGHHLQIITKCKDCKEAVFYIEQATKYSWSRNILVHQMESNLYKRKGKALSNFDYALPTPQGNLAKELLKNPYNFDFLMLEAKAPIPKGGLGRLYVYSNHLYT